MYTHQIRLSTQQLKQTKNVVIEDIFLIGNLGRPSSSKPYKKIRVLVRTTAVQSMHLEATARTPLTKNNGHGFAEPAQVAEKTNQTRVKDRFVA
jgi:hypothetical protein